MADGAPPLNLSLTVKELNQFVDNLVAQNSQPHVVTSIPTIAEEKPDESSSATNLVSSYRNIPCRLKSCLDYCYFVICSGRGFDTNIDRLACLLSVEGLIKQDNSSVDVASKVIHQFIALGLLEKSFIVSEYVSVPSTYRKLCIGKMDWKNHYAKAPDSAIRLFIFDSGKHSICPKFYGLKITSLFDIAIMRLEHPRHMSRGYMETICKLKSLVVLDLTGYIECLPDEIVDLVHLRFLRLNYIAFDTKPHSKSVSLKSFEMMFRNIDEVPAESLDIQQLWQLMINRNATSSNVPKKNGLRLHPHALTNVYARGGIMSELSKYSQLRRLSIGCVSEEHVSELCAAIMNMTYLFSLSMLAEKIIFGKGKTKQVVMLFPEFEAFYPPPRLREVELCGQLVDVPSWLLSMENLSTLTLTGSYLHDDTIFQLQFLPNLKQLHLDTASKATQIRQEFCEAGGFAKLEALSIRSRFLVEWTEIADGAFPSLRSLAFIFCNNLMFLPNGLQNISTLEKLYIEPIHGDLHRRLRGNENYKIKNIPRVIVNSFNQTMDIVNRIIE